MKVAREPFRIEENTMLNIVIPMAGAGSRFAKAGYDLPKPLIEVHDRPMIQVVIDNLRPNAPHRFIFLCQQEHIERFDLDRRLPQLSGDTTMVVPVDGLTEGAASTVLLARRLFENDDPLLIANSDQFINSSIDDFLASCRSAPHCGNIMTMRAEDPKWSFVALDDRRHVTQVVEKEVISNEATVGIYFFARGRDFAEAADAMISRNERVNGEFYVAPAYNDLIAAGGIVDIYNIGAERDGMYGLGIPDDLEYFLTLPLSRT